MTKAIPTDFKLSQPPLYQFNANISDECLPLLEDVQPGDVLQITDDGYRKAHARERGVGIGIKTGIAGQTDYEFAVAGVADGYEPNLPTGDSLYPSATIPGGLDTTDVQDFAPQVRVIGPRSIRFNFQA